MLRVLSLGAGVQSTTLALMAAHREIGPMPDCAIFADTQSEPSAVYQHLRWLMSPNVLPFPVHIVTAGSLADKIMAAVGGRRRNDGRPPLFVKNPDGSQGILHRQCTSDFKIDPIEKHVRVLLGLKPKQHWPKGQVVEQWIGISLDEFQRIKPSRRDAIVRRHPLIEMRMSRWDCLRWIERNGYPKPSKSACTFCPFRTDAEWMDMKKNAPTDFAQAVAIDHAVRSVPYLGLRRVAYVHRSLTPLDRVDFDQNHNQPDLFDNECEGMCGV
jgi:hypothetical protein